MARLPPLKTLPAFEAASRLLSFTEAAEELHITQAAVSHQIKHLEEAMGVRLFRRLNRALMLTEEGESFARAVRDSLHDIATAAERVKRLDAAGPLNVSCLPSFASAWLVPRLARFRAEHPEIEIRLDADYEVTDFDHEDIDIAIRWGTGGNPDLREVHLMTEEVFPVCSPVLLNDPARPLKTPSDLKHHTLLHDDVRTDWRVWMKAADVTDVDPYKGPRYNYANLVLQAAIAGEGVALGRSAIVHDALELGQLVRPFEFAIPSDYAYWVVCPEDRADRPKIKAFSDWLLAQAAMD